MKNHLTRHSPHQHHRRQTGEYNTRMQACHRTGQRHAMHNTTPWVTLDDALQSALTPPVRAHSSSFARLRPRTAMQTCLAALLILQTSTFAYAEDIPTSSPTTGPTEQAESAQFALIQHHFAQQPNATLDILIHTDSHECMQSLQTIFDLPHKRNHTQQPQILSQHHYPNTEATDTQIRVNRSLFFELEEQAQQQACLHLYTDPSSTDAFAQELQSLGALARDEIAIDAPFQSTASVPSPQLEPSSLQLETYIRTSGLINSGEAALSHVKQHIQKAYLAPIASTHSNEESRPGCSNKMHFNEARLVLISDGIGSECTAVHINQTLCIQRDAIHDGTLCRSAEINGSGAKPCKKGSKTQAQEGKLGCHIAKELQALFPQTRFQFTDVRASTWFSFGSDVINLMTLHTAHEALFQVLERLPTIEPHAIILAPPHLLSIHQPSLEALTQLVHHFTTLNLPVRVLSGNQEQHWLNFVPGIEPLTCLQEALCELAPHRRHSPPPRSYFSSISSGIALLGLASVAWILFKKNRRVLLVPPAREQAIELSTLAPTPSEEESTSLESNTLLPCKKQGDLRRAQASPSIRAYLRDTTKFGIPGVDRLFAYWDEPRAEQAATELT